MRTNTRRTNRGTELNTRHDPRDPHRALTSSDDFSAPTGAGTFTMIYFDERDVSLGTSSR